MARNNKRGGGSMSLSEAGKRGGEEVKRTRGREFFSEIGKKGGQARGQQRSEKR